MVYHWFRISMQGANNLEAAFLFVTEAEIVPAVLYTLEVLIDLPLGIEMRGENSSRSNEPVIAYTYSPLAAEVGTWLRADSCLWKNLGKSQSVPDPPLSEFHDAPILFGRPVSRKIGRVMQVEADLIASSFFVVTRYEETVRPNVRDEHGRFPGKSSLPFRAGFLRRPIVDDYSVLFRQILRDAGLDVPRSRRNFSVLPTHDVDSLQYYRRRLQPIRSLAKAALGRGPWANVIDSLAVKMHLRRDPFDNLPETLDIDRLAGGLRAESVFFFIALLAPDRYLGRRGIRESRVRKALSFLRDEGVSVGLHASYDAGSLPHMLRSEVALLTKVTRRLVRRNRHHYLRWREPKDGWRLVEAGINWDSTLGYPDEAGFRLGVCRPIQLFDPVKMKRFGIEEHPLVVMDASLSESKYMDLTEDEAFEVTWKLLEQTRKHRGEFVTLWHNNYLSPSDPKSTYHPRLYRRLMSQIGVLSSSTTTSEAESPPA